MNFAMQVSQELTQTLTTEQIQHLEILQFCNMELERYLYNKANENPLITVIEPEIQHVNNIIDMSITRTKTNSYTSTDSPVDYMQTLPAKKESAFKFLIEQIPLHQNLCKQDQRILKYLIYNLNEKFFLDVELEEVANVFQVDVETVENLLFLLHTFEPIGVGARNAVEYLLIQIDYDLNAPPLAAEFVKNHLDKVADLSVNFLSKHYKISPKETQQILQYIRTLKPTPYINSPAPKDIYIIPDVAVKKVNSEWIINLNHHLRPSIEINQEYVALLNQSPSDKAYCQGCLKDIMILMQGIEQRDKTLYSLIRHLLVVQSEFFDFGKEALKPIRLKDVAAALNLHESTISRAIRNKYLQTPHGIYPIRSLFVKGLTNLSGKSDSVMYIKKRITELIENEDRSKPLSDQHLTITLQAEGIQISRRTITKYREELNIRSSSKRCYLYKN